MRYRFLIVIVVIVTMLFTSCKGEKICAGLNRETGKANTTKSARRGYRGGYRSPKELAARDRQKKHIKKAKRKKGRSSMGGK